MRIGDWTDIVPVAQPWQAPLPEPVPDGLILVPRAPRAVIAPAMGGAVAHLNAGYIGDEPITLRWDWMYATPSVMGGTVTTLADANVILPHVHTLERLAAPVNPGAFAAIGAARLWLRHVGACTGYLTVEIWSDNGAGVPLAKLGTIGYIDVAAFGAGVWTGVEVFSDTAYPIDPTNGGHIVLSAAEMVGLAGNRVEWGAQNLGGSHYYYPSGGPWAVVANEDLSVTTWAGAAHCILRGLMASGNWELGAGPNTYEIDIEDGQLYTGVLLDVDGRLTVKPHAVGGAIAVPPASLGVAHRVSATIGIYDELNS